jgi:anti-sigma regulatory factor (Ser/Thr protein kinase)
LEIVDLRDDLLISIQESTDVAQARRLALGAAKDAGMGDRETGAVGIVVTEAATNLLKHASGGEIVVQRRDSIVTILAFDRGKGMVNVLRCLEDGYSTAGSPGTGLGAMRRLSNHFDIYSLPGAGTVLLAQIGAAKPAPGNVFTVGAICAPAPGEEVSGDAWTQQSSPGGCRVVVADGLGHGPGAAAASQPAIQAAKDHPLLPPAALIDVAHARLRPTRGAAISIAEIRLHSGQVVFSGVGNVAGFVVSDTLPRRQMVSTNGTAGHQMRTAQEFLYPWTPRGVLILHSDGIQARWELERYPGLFQRHPSIIASVLFRDFRRGRDDATVVVVRQTEKER